MLADPFRLKIPRPIFDAMVAHAVAALPAECCGLLAGRVADGVGTITHGLPLVNALHAPDEFESESMSLFAAHKAMRAAAVEILAVYHSHPTSDPIPSKRDRERNFDERVMSVIVGLAGAVPDVRVWWLTATDHRPAEWETVDGPALPA